MSTDPKPDRSRLLVDFFAKAREYDITFAPPPPPVRPRFRLRSKFPEVREPLEFVFRQDKKPGGHPVQIIFPDDRA